VNRVNGTDGRVWTIYADVIFLNILKENLTLLHTLLGCTKSTLLHTLEPLRSPVHGFFEPLRTSTASLVHSLQYTQNWTAKNIFQVAVLISQTQRQSQIFDFDFLVDLHMFPKHLYSHHIVFTIF